MLPPMKRWMPAKPSLISSGADRASGRADRCGRQVRRRAYQCHEVLLQTFDALLCPFGPFIHRGEPLAHLSTDRIEFGLDHARRLLDLRFVLHALSIAHMHEICGSSLPLGVVTRQGRWWGSGRPFPALVDGRAVMHVPTAITDPNAGYRENWSFTLSRLTGTAELKDDDKPVVTYTCGKATQRF
jgi:hypothetical protein